MNDNSNQSLGYNDRYLTQHKSKSLISRTILDLNIQQLKQPNHKKQNLRYPKILNTDQSHINIQSIDYQHSNKHLVSLNQSQIQKGEGRYLGHKSSATVSLRDELRYRRHIQEILEMRHKKQIVQQIKFSHRQKISQIAIQKVDQLNNLRRSLARQNTQINKKIQTTKHEVQQQKIKKHQMIKDYFKSQKTSFQKDFIKKGLKSIRKEFQSYQKRNKSLQQSLNCLQAEHKNELQEKGENIKKQFKEYSINVSNLNKLAEIMMKQSTNGQNKREKLKKDIELYNNSRQKSLASINSQFLNINIQDSMNNNKKNQLTEQNLKDLLQKKKLKKKRLIHSVFPQQFYPLKQSNQIGFQLPKIHKK